VFQHFCTIEHDLKNESGCVQNKTQKCLEAADRSWLIRLRNEKVLHTTTAETFFILRDLGYTVAVTVYECSSKCVFA